MATHVKHVTAVLMIGAGALIGVASALVYDPSRITVASCVGLMVCLTCWTLSDDLRIDELARTADTETNR